MFARVLYTALLYLLLPFVLLRLWWRGRKNPDYRGRIAERLGIIPHKPKKGGVWIHAVSVGELLAAAPLIKAHLSAEPDVPVIVTTTTPTGSRQVKRLFRESVYHMYMPYDIPKFIKRFLSAIHPSMLIIMETELWPNVIDQCHRRHIPVVLANARLSQSSCDGYAKFGLLSTPMLQKMHTVVAQHELDGERFLSLGLPPKKLTVMSNIKFDVSVPDQIHDQGEALRQQFGGERPVIALASSHEGEDELLLEHLPALHQRFSNALLMIVPRHPERFDPVANAVRKAGFRLTRRSHHINDSLPTSEASAPSAETQVYLADTMGEMLTLLAAADVVIMGASLIKGGGHNPIEPAALGKPVLMGPHYVNFKSIADDLHTLGALAFIDPSDPFATACALLDDEPRMDAMQSAALNAVAESRGTVDALLALTQRIRRERSPTLN